MSPEERERVVVRRLRIAVGLMFGLAATAAIVGYLPHGIERWDPEYRLLDQQAGGHMLAIYLGALMLPGAGVAQRPRWPQIAVWIMWAVPWTILALLMRVDTHHYEASFPHWPAYTVYTCVGLLLALLCLGLPLIRRMHQAPPLARVRIPAARVVVTR